MIASRRQSILIHLFLLIVLLIVLGPLLYTLMTSLKLLRDMFSGSFFFTPTLANYEELFFGRRSNFLLLTRNSIITGLGSMLVILFVASLGAYSLSRFRWRRLYSGLIMGWLVFVHMLPPIIFVGPYYLNTRALGIYDTPLATIMAHTILNLPLAFWMLHSFFSEVPPELEEAAAIDGCGYFKRFTHIVLPLARPGIAATAVLVFIFSWKEFLFALSLTSTANANTIPIGIASFAQEYNIRYGEMAAAAFFATIPAIFMVAFAQRHIVKGLTLGALKG
ncbi:MAG: carbohydrate ABC transporter permease [Chloroflexota bacterium]|nr:MAG: carbohydrate ABC transporter permease [Chloroflexota bacterium]